MKDFIQNDEKEVGIVIYDAPLPPKYFRLSKKFIRTFSIVVPSFLGIVLTGLFIWGLGSRLKETDAPSLPNLSVGQSNQVAELESEIKILTKSNKELAEKVATIPSMATPEDPFLMVIKKPYGMQNFLAKNQVSLDQFQFELSPKKINLKFQIISSSPETKVTGHILVFMISDAGLSVYPKNAISSLHQGLKYSAGETFSVSRLRPTNAEFEGDLTSGSSVKFVVYIFNREGDLLLIKETEAFKAGAQ